MPPLQALEKSAYEADPRPDGPRTDLGGSTPPIGSGSPAAAAIEAVSGDPSGPDLATASHGAAYRADRADLIDSLQALLDRTEPLADELQPFVGQVGGLGWPALRHPLVYAVPYIPHHNAMLNAMLRQKRQALTQALQDGDMDGYVFVYERPYRVDAIREWCRLRQLAKTQAEEVAATSYWRCVSWAWRDSENILEDLMGWMRLWLRPPHPGYLAWRHLATDEADRQALQAMPDLIEVWHGEERPGHVGWSWTTDIDVARWFARRFDARGAVFRALAPKQHLIAYMTQRNEQEILIEPQHLLELQTIEKVAKPSRSRRGNLGG